MMRQTKPSVPVPNHQGFHLNRQRTTASFTNLSARRLRIPSLDTKSLDFSKNRGIRRSQSRNAHPKLPFSGSATEGVSRQDNHQRRENQRLSAFFRSPFISGSTDASNRLEDRRRVGEAVYKGRPA
jgi:hypothetical protein